MRRWAHLDTLCTKLQGGGWSKSEDNAPSNRTGHGHMAVPTGRSYEQHGRITTNGLIGSVHLILWHDANMRTGQVRREMFRFLFLQCFFQIFTSGVGLLQGSVAVTTLEHFYIRRNIHHECHWKYFCAWISTDTFQPAPTTICHSSATPTTCARWLKPYQH